MTFFLAKLENIFYLAGQKYTTLNRELPSEVNTTLAKSYELLLGINNYSLIIETLQQSSILAELMVKELEELRHLLKMHKSQFVQLYEVLGLH